MSAVYSSVFPANSSVDATNFAATGGLLAVNQSDDSIGQDSGRDGENTTMPDVTDASVSRDASDSRRCTVRGCNAIIPPDNPNKMCEACRSRHRIYATTKRAKRKMEKAAMLGGGWLPEHNATAAVVGSQTEENSVTSNPISWDGIIDPQLFTSQSSELAGALTLPSDPATASSSSSPSASQNPPIPPTEDLIASSSAPPRYCSVKGCKAIIHGDYFYKMCEPCRDRYRIYGTTKRAKWKRERMTTNAELLEMRAEEDKRRETEGLKPLSECPDELKQWEENIIATQAQAPPQTTLDPSPFSHPPDPLDIALPARMCTVSHCHQILPGSYRYRRCEEHRLQNRHHSHLKRVREKQVKSTGPAGLPFGGAPGASTSSGSASGDNTNQLNESTDHESSSAVNDVLTGPEDHNLPLDPNIGNTKKTVLPPLARGIRRTFHICSIKNCQNLLSPAVPWKMCDICKGRDKVARNARRAEPKTKGDHQDARVVAAAGRKVSDQSSDTVAGSRPGSAMGDDIEGVESDGEAPITVAESPMDVVNHQMAISPQVNHIPLSPRTSSAHNLQSDNLPSASPATNDQLRAPDQPSLNIGEPPRPSTSTTLPNLAPSMTTPTTTTNSLSRVVPSVTSTANLQTVPASTTPVGGRNDKSADPVRSHPQNHPAYAFQQPALPPDDQVSLTLQPPDSANPPAHTVQFVHHNITTQFVPIVPLNDTGSVYASYKKRRRAIIPESTSTTTGSEGSQIPVAPSISTTTSPAASAQTAPIWRPVQPRVSHSQGQGPSVPVPENHPRPLSVLPPLAPYPTPSPHSHHPPQAFPYPAGDPQHPSTYTVQYYIPSPHAMAPYGSPLYYGAELPTAVHPGLPHGSGPGTYYYYTAPSYGYAPQNPYYPSQYPVPTSHYWHHPPAHASTSSRVSNYYRPARKRMRVERATLPRAILPCADTSVLPNTLLQLTRPTSLNIPTSAPNNLQRESDRSSVDNGPPTHLTSRDHLIVAPTDQSQKCISCHRSISQLAPGRICKKCKLKFKKRQSKSKLKFKLEPRKAITGTPMDGVAVSRV